MNLDESDSKSMMLDSLERCDWVCGSAVHDEVDLSRDRLAGTLRYSEHGACVPR